MFSNTKTSTNQISKIDTLIGTSTNITGNIVATGVIRIDGKYAGDISTESDVIIGEGGYIKGNVRAVSVSISGNVEGNMCCSGTLEILSTGSLIGDVEVANFSIGKGAIFNGNCKMVNRDTKKINSTSEVGFIG
jgi:cytoskeletal protein CcmA (bactofilin family)